MTALKLSARLEAIARLIPKIGGVVDVGTDHGYIPVWLAQNGHVSKLIATDIKKAPLDHARQTAALYGQMDKISFLLCDGLSALDGKGIQTVVIAGMGGENIAQILAAAPWIRENNCLLILQPMSKAGVLRAWLYENDYAVLSEQLVEDGGVYELLTARSGEGEAFSPAELLIGHTRLISQNPLYLQRLDQLIKKSEGAVRGLALSTKEVDASRMSEEAALLDALYELRKRHKSDR